jgi:hypothetical protein
MGFLSGAKGPRWALVCLLLAGALLAATAGDDGATPTVTVQRTVVHAAEGGGSFVAVELLLADAEGQPVACTPEMLAALGTEVGVSLTGCGGPFDPWTRWDVACTRAGQVDVALVLDVDGPGLGYLRRVKGAAIDLADRVLAGTGRVAVVRAADVPEVAAGLTADRDKVRNGIRALLSSDEGTALWDAVRLGAEALREEGAGTYADAEDVRDAREARAIVVVTDGGDDSARLRRELDPEDRPRTRLADAQALAVGRAPVFVVGVGDEVDGVSLGSLATATGGRYLAAGTYGLGDAFDRVAFPANVEVVVSLLGVEPGQACVELGWSWEVEGVVVAGEDVTEVPVFRDGCAKTGEAATVFEFRARVARAFCAAAQDAGSEVPLAHGAEELTYKACLATADGFVAGWWGDASEDLHRRVRSGALRIHQERASDCVDSLCAMPPTHTILGKLQWPEACWEAFVGQREAGEECASTLDCSRGLVCDQPVDGCMGTCGEGSGRTFACTPACGPGQACYPLPDGPTCLPKARQDEVCRNAFECAPGLVCDYHLQRCLRPEDHLEAGEACRPSIDGCAWPGRCLPDDAGAMRCGPPRNEQEPCRVWWFDCGPGLFCEAGPEPNVGVCRAEKRAGRSCTHDWECAGFCAPEGVCDNEPRERGKDCVGAVQ